MTEDEMAAWHHRLNGPEFEPPPRPVYTNHWAVQVLGGPAVADRVAAAHGYLNLGQVSAVAPRAQNFGCRRRARREGAPCEESPGARRGVLGGQRGSTPTRTPAQPRGPMDRGAWWASVYGVAQSWTRLKRLSFSDEIGRAHV